MNAALHRPALRAARAVAVTGAPARTVLEVAMAADQVPADCAVAGRVSTQSATVKTAGVV
jgi:hypothetical protein